MQADTKTGLPADEALNRYVGYFESAEQSSTDARENAERDRDFHDGHQWTAEEVATLEKRAQPVITDNRIAPKVRFLLGMEQQHRADPKAYPRTPNEEEGANAATDALLFVCDDQRWDRKRSEAFEHHLIEGAWGIDISVVDKNGEPDIGVTPIKWDRLFWDPHSRLRDFSDAKFKGQFIWMDLDDAIIRWPDKLDEIELTVAGEPSTSGNTSNDIPRTRWADPKRKRVRIVEIWCHEEGTVYHTFFTKAGILERVESEYLDEDGKPEDGFVFGSCFVDRDGNRYGVVRDWISMQSEINKRRSKALHLMSVRQTWGNKLTGDKNALRKELTKADGHVELEGEAKFGEDFGVLPTGDMADAQFELLQEAKGAIDAVGVNAALQGKDERLQSGRALMARSEQGLNELGPVFDGFKQGQLDVYRKIWNRIRQYWTAEKWVRVTDDEKNVRFVGLNQPLTLGQQLLDEAKQQGQPITPEMEQQAKMDPRMQVVVGVKNNVSKLDVDITIDDVPASASLQSEQFEALVKIAPQAATMPPPLFEALLQASSLRNKDKILKSLRGEEEGQESPAMQQMKQQMQEMQQALAEATAAANDKSQDAALKDREIKIKETEVQMKRAESQRTADPAVQWAEAELEKRSAEIERQALELQHARELFERDQRIAALELQTAEQTAQATQSEGAAPSGTAGGQSSQGQPSYVVMDTNGGLSKSIGDMTAGNQALEATVQALAEGQAMNAQTDQTLAATIHELAQAVAVMAQPTNASIKIIKQGDGLYVGEKVEGDKTAAIRIQRQPDGAYIGERVEQ